ncbi:methyl-accepting chemotaxis protein [Spirochaetota bacterium]
MKKEMTIRGKILAGVLSLCGLFLIAGALAIYSMQLQYEAGYNLGIEHAPQVDAAMEIKLTATTAHLWFEEVMTGAEEKERIKEVWKLLDETKWYVNALLKGGKNEEGTFIALDIPKVIEAIKKVQKDVDEFVEAAKLRFKNKFESKIAKDDSALDAQFDKLFDKFIKNADEAESHLQEYMKEARKDMKDTYDAGLMILIISITLAIGLGIVISLFLARVVNGGIEEVNGQVIGISGNILNGNLKERTTPDDVGIDFQEMARQVNELIEAFIKPINLSSEYIEQIASGEIPDKIVEEYRGDFNTLKNNINKMVESIREFAISAQGTSAQVASGSEEMSSSAQEMAQSAAEQAASVEEVSSSMEEMNSTVMQNADNARETAQIAEKAAIDAREGGKSVVETVEAMKSIAEKISIIEDIARQTNMLALNAAIEAARAGEHGKGFAVVADEVRNLAGRSGDAAREISELSGTSVEIAEKAGSVIEAIVPQIQKTAELVQEINAASSEQANGIEQVSTSIEQLDKGIQQNTAATEQMASTSEELSSQAVSLQRVASFFKVNGSGIGSEHITTPGAGAKTHFTGFEKKESQSAAVVHTAEGDKKGVDIDMAQDDEHFERF